MKKKHRIEKKYRLDLDEEEAQNIFLGKVIVNINILKNSLNKVRENETYISFLEKDIVTLGILKIH